MEEPVEFKVSKDDRNKQRRAKNRFVKKKAGYVSSSPEPQSVIDVADSSDDSYYKRAKACNWSRYEEDTEVDFIENEQMNAADFEFLQQNPTRGSHFTFSSEKEWETDSTVAKTMNISYFNLNLPIINAGLQTIPFYKRMDYGELNFSKNAIKEMDKAAETAEMVYKSLLKDVEDDLMKKVGENSSKESSAKSTKDKSTKIDNSKPEEKTSESAAIPKDNEDDELDKLLNMTESDLSQVNLSENTLEVLPNSETAAMDGSEKTNTITITEKGDGVEVESENKDIQQWLDGILN